MSKKHHSFGKSLLYAATGFKWGVRRERNFGLEIGLAVLAFVTGSVLQLSPLRLAVIVVMSVLVLSFEILNTAIEMLANVASPTYHPMIRQVKDMSAAAVLIAAIGALIVGGLLFGPPIKALFADLFSVN